MKVKGFFKSRRKFCGGIVSTRGGRPRGLVAGGGAWGGRGRDRCAPGPSVPRRSRAERRGAARHATEHVRAPADSRRRARAHRPRATRSATWTRSPMTMNSRAGSLRYVMAVPGPGCRTTSPALSAADMRAQQVVCARGGCGARVLERPW